MILCSVDTAGTHKLSDISLENETIFDERYATMIDEPYARTAQTPYSKIALIHYHALSKKRRYLEG